MTKFDADIIVAGAGPAGLIAALALANAGAGVTLVGPRPSGADRRTTALMLPSLGLLDRIGVLEALSDAAAPLETMRIIDVTGRLIRSPTVTFRAAEIGERHFGLNIPNAVLLNALTDAVDARPSIAWRQEMAVGWEIGAQYVRGVLSGGDSVGGRLLVAADGRDSPARAAAGIGARRRDLPQAALVFNIAHDRAHGFASNEFHTPYGPFTQVPLPGRRSSIVWVGRPDDAAALARLPGAELARRAEIRMESMFGKVAIDGRTQLFRLAEGSASKLAANRVALIGEAAHLIPPIGAQGLNLGCADIAVLSEVMSGHEGDPGGAAALAAYDRRRRTDVAARSTAVNLLNHSLLSDLLPAQAARAAGLTVLNAFAPLRGFFMREGLQPGSGFGALASGLKRAPASREQVGR